MTKLFLIGTCIVLYLSAATWFALAAGKYLRWRNGNIEGNDD
jgi:hypothetical protein